jgi:nucleotide-binding universal stress UspA family protein
LSSASGIARSGVGSRRGAAKAAGLSGRRESLYPLVRIADINKEHSVTAILVAVDGSSHSARVARAVIRHVSAYKVPPELHLAYVHLPVPTMGGLIKPIGHEALQRYYREEGEDALRGAKKLLDRAKLASTMHVMVGPIAETLAGEAKKLKCDLIIMGTHGMGAVSGMLLGSVASRTVHLARCPVVLIRE